MTIDEPDEFMNCHSFVKSCESDNANSTSRSELSAQSHTDGADDLAQYEERVHESHTPRRKSTTLNQAMGQHDEISGTNRTQGPGSNLWTMSSKLPWLTFTSSDILIAVMGMTGSGKTSFISDVTGVDMEIGHGLQSCTREIQIATMEILGCKVHLIDTPGFDDTDIKDSDILLKIANHLGESHHGDASIRLSGILYLHRITDPKVTGSALKNLSMFRKLVGDKNMCNVILLTTMWSKVTPEDGENRLQELIGFRKFWGGLLNCGATYDRYQSRPADAHRIVTMMMRRNAPMVTQLQEELGSGTKLSDTTAGREVGERLEDAQAQHRKEIEEIRKEIAVARNERNLEVGAELQAHYEKLLEDMQEMAKVREQMHQNDLENMRARIKDLENKGNGCSVM